MYLWFTVSQTASGLLLHLCGAARLTTQHYNYHRNNVYVKYQPNYLMAMFCMYLYTSENPKIGKLDFDIIFFDFGTGYSLHYYLDFSQTDYEIFNTN